MIVFFLALGNGLLLSWSRRRSCLCLHRRRRCGLRWSRGRTCRFAVPSNRSHYRIDLHGVPLDHFDVLQNTRGGRRDLSIHLVSRDLEQRLIALHFVAGLLQPLGNGSLKNRLAHLRHYDIGRHNFLLRSPSGSSRAGRIFNYIQRYILALLTAWLRPFPIQRAEDQPRTTFSSSPARPVAVFVYAKEMP